MNEQARRVRPITAVLLGGFMLAASSCSPEVAASPGQADRHGAAPMDTQLQRLGGLAITSDPRTPPSRVDPVIWELFVPDDNKLDQARVALGRKLYFDTRLSADGTVACATCHDVTRGFTDQRPVAEGINGQLGRRNSPTTMNAALLQTQFWDGRVPSLEEQALLPIINPIEMGQKDGAAAVAAIAGDKEYQQMFQTAYGRAVNYKDIGRAIASFERTLIFLDSPFMRYLLGDGKAISPAAKRGWVLFNGKARCVTCHPVNLSNPLGSDNRFHNIGVAAKNRDFDELAGKALAMLQKDGSLEKIDELALETDLSELGRFLITKNEAEIGAFRTSQLTNIGITGPYMHDGSMHTLWDVMDHYNKGGEHTLYLDGGIEALALTEAEIDDLVAFLFTLTDARFSDTNDQKMEEQKKRAAEQRPFRDVPAAMRKVLPGEPGK